MLYGSDGACAPNHNGSEGVEGVTFQLGKKKSQKSARQLVLW